MKSRKKIFMLTIFLITAVLVITMCGCSDSKVHVKEQSKCTVGVVLKSGTSEYWMSVCSGMKDAAEQFNIDVMIMYPDTEQQEKQQEAMAQEFVDRDVDVLAVSPVNSGTSPDYVKSAQDKGISVVTFDTYFDGIELPYTGMDNEKIGYELGKCMAEVLMHKGDVGIIAGNLNQTCHRERVSGFCRYMETEPDMNVVFTESGYANMQMSEDKVRKLAADYSSVRGVLATSAVTAMGLADGLKENGIMIVSVDAQTDSLQALADGRIAALAAQSGYEIGYETIRQISEMADGIDCSYDNILDAEILTTENAEEYINENQKQKHTK